jgi:serine/threonine-protein kinase BUR1
MDITGLLTDGTQYSEVHMAKSRRNGAIVALKKILMHNEKDGVCLSPVQSLAARDPDW